MKTRTLLFATTNPGKQREISRLLKGPGWRTVFPESAGGALDVAETGASFAENAMIKARAYSTRLPGAWVAAEDSGLIVPALGGEPGIFSARYGGGSGDASRNALLLERMAKLKGDERAAHYEAVIVLLDPQGSERAFVGRANGVILAEPRGKGGFGYDPIFLDPSSNMTFAEMKPAEKDRLSHRGQALRAMVEYLREFPFGDAEWKR